MILKLVFSCRLLLIVVSSAWASDPIVRSPAGTFLGSSLTAWNGQVYNAFRGIPFAKPPVRDLRFQPPIPLDPIGKCISSLTLLISMTGFHSRHAKGEIATINNYECTAVRIAKIQQKCTLENLESLL